jgi:signal transduction histidine kinase
MLINLAGNAIKFTETGSVTLRADFENGRPVYRVTDTGPGVEDTYREKIFTAFDRGDPATSRNTNGSGLGLSIARGSARVMGATLELAPQSPTGGATFVVTLEPG